MDNEHINIIAQVAENFNLVSHEFGEYGIDRFIIVYKPEYEPNDDELARMNLKYTEKLNPEQIEKVLSMPPVEELEEEKPKRKKKKAVEEEEPVEKLIAIGTVKRVRKSTAEAIEETRMRKKTSNIDVDALFDEK